MKKSELLKWLQDEYQQWEALLGEIGPMRMDQPGVNGAWSMKDIIAHLTGWQRRFNAHLAAASHSEPKPPPPWPAHLKTDDEINNWIYASNHASSVSEVLDEAQQVLQQLLAIIEGLPEDVRIEQVHHEGKEYCLLWLGEERFLAGEFFDHFHDDHEQDVRTWLAQEDKK